MDTVNPDQIITKVCTLKTIDIHTCKKEDLVFDAPWKMVPRLISAAACLGASGCVLALMFAACARHDMLPGTIVACVRGHPWVPSGAHLGCHAAVALRGRQRLLWARRCKRWRPPEAEGRGCWWCCSMGGWRRDQADVGCLVADDAARRLPHGYGHLLRRGLHQDPQAHLALHRPPYVSLSRVPVPLRPALP